MAEEAEDAEGAGQFTPDELEAGSREHSLDTLRILRLRSGRWALFVQQWPGLTRSAPRIVDLAGLPAAYDEALADVQQAMRLRPSHPLKAPHAGAAPASVEDLANLLLGDDL
jgi:hypothetical protein